MNRLINNWKVGKLEIFLYNWVQKPSYEGSNFYATLHVVHFGHLTIIYPKRRPSNEG